MKEWVEGSMRVLGKLVRRGWPFWRMVAEDGEERARPRRASFGKDNVFTWRSLSVLGSLVLPVP